MIIARLPRERQPRYKIRLIAAPVHSPASRLGIGLDMLNASWQNAVYQGARLVFWAALLMGGWYLYRVQGLPALPTRDFDQVIPAWPACQSPPVEMWHTVFKKLPPESITAALGPLAKRFRLAGTFFAVGNNQQARKAILDDLQTREQQLVAEGDLLGQTVRVVTIMPDKITLREGTHDEDLWLSFAGTGGDSATGGVAAVAALGAGDFLSRVGKRVEDQRWVMKRNELLGYYQELLNNPNRLAKVFESLKPVYQQTGKIAGYVLDVEGEADMFQAFGLKQNDIIWKVNSMPMISQSRAEYFIDEFVNNRVNGFVLEIERDNKPERLVYLIR